MQLRHKDFTGALVKDDSLDERQIRVVVSTPQPDRVKDVMEPKGCDIANYKLNPIVLADHNPKTPIGNAAIEVKDQRVEAVITFAPQGVSAKADEYCGLAKAGILNTVSPGFRELDTSPIKGGGVHIKSWELLELSLVSVPANPDAVVIGRSFKADANWKVGASRNLPLGDDEAWDGAAAKQSVFDKAGFDGDEPDTTFARKAFLVYDAANPEEKGSYKLPFAKVVDGRLVAVPAGIRNAASRLPQTDIPDDVAEKARAVIDHYEGKMKDKEGKSGAAVVKIKSVKGLYDVAQLAYLLDQLGWIEDCAEWEAALEGDGSKVPDMLAAVLQQLAQAFLAMANEEVSELLAEEKDEDGDTVDVIGDDDLKSLSAAIVTKIKALPSPFAKALAVVRAKAGRTISAANEKTMRESLKSIKSGHDAMMGMLDDNSADMADDDTASETDTGKAMPLALSERERELEVLRLKSV